MSTQTVKPAQTSAIPTSPKSLFRQAFSHPEPLGAVDVAAALCFFATMPVALPIFDLLSWTYEDGSVGGGPTAFFGPMALASMGCALAVLFICLLKTAHASLGRGTVVAGAVCHAVGMLVCAALAGSTGLLEGPYLAVSIATGALLGAGCILVCCAWSLRLRCPNARQALAAFLVVVGASLVLHTALRLFVPAAVMRWMLAVLGAAGALGSAVRLARSPHVCGPRVVRGGSSGGAGLSGGAGSLGASSGGAAPAVGVGSPAAPDSPGAHGPLGASSSDSEAGPNWWDVFGRLDTALMTGDEFAAPVSRALFFLVVPVLMGLLWVADGVVSASEVVPTACSGFMALAGSLLACAIALPLLRSKSDRAFVNVGFHVALPLVALVALACGSYGSGAVGRLAAHTGIVAFCTLYCLLMGALVFSMPGRMKSLALPCTCIVCLVVNLAALLAFSPLEMGRATFAQPLLAAVCLVCSVALLLVTPGARMWAVMTDLITLDAPAVPPQGPSFAERVRRLAAEYGLTERESQVFPYLTRGHGAAYIASEINVAESTVRTHRTNIYRKLGIASREELLALIDAARASEASDPVG